MKYFFNKAVLFLAVFFLFFIFGNKVFAETDIDENSIISTDTVWTKDAGPYVIQQDVLVDTGATLTIEAGTIIKVERGIYINVLGNLTVNGSENEKVYFTSFNNDSIGGDTDEEEDYYGPEYSYWGGIYVFDGGSLNMNNSEISYSAHSLSFVHGNGVLNSIRVNDSQEALDIYESNVSLDQSIIEDIYENTTYNSAIYLYSNNTLSINNSTIRNIYGGAISSGGNSKLTFYDSNLENVIGGMGIDIYYDSSIDIENSNIKDIYKGISVYNNSKIILKNSVIDGVSNGRSAMLEVLNDSLLTISSSTIKNISADSVFEIFSGVDANISNLSVKDIFADEVFCVYGGSKEYATTTFNISSSTLSNGDGTAFQIFSKVKANISNVKIEGFSGIGIETFSYPEIHVINSEISGNDIGIASYGSNLEIVNNSIKDNKTFGIYNIPPSYAKPIKAINNWWGNESGPFNNISNASGTANTVSENVEFSPWLKTDPNKKRNPVIIIPGILSSYLNKNDYTHEEVWLNLTKAMSSLDDSYLDDLSLTKFGEPDLTKTLVLPTDIFRKIKVSSLVENDFFDGLIKELENNGYKEGEDLFVFPYDWRLDIRDIVDNSYTPLNKSLKDKIDEILQKSGSGKIDIIAHSMGGLISKYYIKNYGLGKVDKFIDIATPHLGSPDSFKILMSGDDMGIEAKGLSFLNSNKIKEISQNMSSVYQLLPSQSYFSTSSPGYEYYIDDLDDYDNNNIKGRLSFEESNNFIKNTGRNSYVMDKSISIHNDIDSFDSKDYGIKSYNIVGCGMPTVGKIFTLGKQNKSDSEFDIAYISGDGTVPQRSAEALISADRYYKTGVKHPVISSSDGVRELVSSFLNNNINNFDFNSFNTISTSSDKCKLPNGTTLSFHSPVDVHIYDELGNHTGPDINGDLEENVPDITYDIFENNKFIFLPDGKKYQIKLQATDKGSFSAHIKKIQDENIISTSYFSDIPLLSTSTKAEVNIENTNHVIILDSMGDGVNKEAINPVVMEGDSLDDRVVPVTQLKVISPVISDKGFYKSNVSISFEATDVGSGILKTEYSFDGENYQEVKGVIVVSKDGENEIFYRSVDKAGNIENPKNIIIKIVRPEATTRVIGSKSQSNIDIQSTSTNNEELKQPIIFTKELTTTLIPSLDIKSVKSISLLDTKTYSTSTKNLSSSSNTSPTASVINSKSNIKTFAVLIIIFSVLGILVFIKRKYIIKG